MKKADAYRLLDGRVILAPVLPDLAEFALVGNHRAFADFAAFYDEGSMTGALYYHGARKWLLQHPIGRAEFWEDCEQLVTLGALPAPIGARH